MLRESSGKPAMVIYPYRALKFPNLTTQHTSKIISVSTQFEVEKNVVYTVIPCQFYSGVTGTFELAAYSSDIPSITIQPIFDPGRISIKVSLFMLFSRSDSLPLPPPLSPSRLLTKIVIRQTGWLDRYNCRRMHQRTHLDAKPSIYIGSQV